MAEITGEHDLFAFKKIRVSQFIDPFVCGDCHSEKYEQWNGSMHTKSEFCGLCHNVSHTANKLPLEQTYNEWKNSPYNTQNSETTVNCQDCHMRQRPGIPATGKTNRPDNPCKAADDGPDRKHIWTHYFAGANTLGTKILKNKTHTLMAIERLKNAADLKFIKNSSCKKNSLARISIKVINSGAGHC